uniref:ubiquitinyl hydrolase 1 n=1 Tax=Panagrellus redivivus TaxID=6233 RepID=A0A7E4ZRM8_PANRE
MLDQMPNTFADLKKMGDIDPRTASQLKSKDCPSLFSHACKTYDKGIQYSRLGDKQRAYPLFLRAGIICGIIAKQPDKHRFLETAEGKHYRDVFTNILEATEKLSDELQTYYADAALAKSLDIQMNIEPEPAAVAPATPGQALLESLETTIKPKDIVTLAKEGLHVLIIDFRPNKEAFIDFREDQLGKNIIVAKCLPNHIEGNITLSQFSKILPVQERPKVYPSEMQKYDLVVFMDEQDVKVGNDGRLQPPANFLMNCLTEYAYNSPLRRPPVTLKGGFTLWKHAYGCYVDSGARSSLFNDDDDFLKVLNDCRRSVNVSYPDLYPSRVEEPAWPSNVPQASNSAPSIAHNRVPSQPSLPPKEAVSVKPAVPEATAFPSHEGPPVSVPSRSAPARPTIDRATKPPARISPESAPSIAQANNNPIVAQAPKVPVLGGARVAEPIPKPRTLPAAPPPAGFVDSYVDVSNGYPRRQYPVPEVPPPSKVPQPQPLVPQRPPIPDRSTKVPPLSSQDHIYKLMAVYEKMYTQLESRSAPGPPPVGFRNLGNTCFMNTTLQAIINTPKMRDIFTRNVFTRYINENNTLGTKGIISTAFSAMMDLYWSGRVRVIVPDIFLRTFADEVSRELVDGRQHDAQEFQIHFLDYLHEDMNQVRKRTPFSQDYDGRNLPAQAADYTRKLAQFSSSPIADLFNLRTVSIITCDQCSTSSATFEESSQISLELEYNAPAQLAECLRKHFRREVLKGDSRWNCPNCHRPVVASRETFIWQLPQTLVIHLKRFSQGRDGEFYKTETPVHFDVNGLSLLDFVHPAALRQHGSYDLYAITNHLGKLNHGHYTSYVRNQHSWLKYNDDIVSEVGQQHLNPREAFVLFYAASGLSAKR